MIILMYIDKWRNHVITNICIDFEIVLLFNNKTSLKYFLIHVRRQRQLLYFYFLRTIQCNIIYYNRVQTNYFSHRQRIIVITICIFNVIEMQVAKNTVAFVILVDWKIAYNFFWSNVIVQRVLLFFANWFRVFRLVNYFV